VGTIVNHYGQDEYMVVDLCLSDRLRWLFWPEDLEVITTPPAVVAFAYATRNPALIDLRELRLGEFL
jgi:hypothetical protein